LIFEETVACDELEIGYYNPCDYLEVNFLYHDANGDVPAYTNGQPVTLYSNVNGGTPPYSYIWTFYPDPSTGFTNDGNIQISWDENPQLTFSHEGLYPVKLQIMDQEGCVNWYYGDIRVVSPWDCYHNFTVTCEENWNQRDFVVVPLYGIDDYGNGGLCRDLFNYHYWTPWGTGCTSFAPCLNPSVNWHVQGGQFWDPNNDPGEGYIYAWFLLKGIFDVSASIDGGGCGDAEDHLPVIVTDCSGDINSQDIIDYNSQGFNPNPPTDLLVLNSVSPTPYVAGSFVLDNDLSSQLFFQYGNFDFIACDKIVLENGFETGEGKYIFETNRINNCDVGYLSASVPPLPNNQQAINNPKELIFSGNLFNVSPNPFTKEITLSFTINQDSPVEIAIFNTIGQKIATLVNDNFTSGNYDIPVDIGYLKPGIYFCGIRTSNFNQTKKIVKL